MDKIKKIKILSAVSIIGTILAITVAFALITRSMVINGSGNVKPALWDIHFKDISEPTITGGASIINSPTVADKGAKIDNLEVRLSLPQDKIEYTVYIENSGDMNAKIDDIKYPTLTEEESKIFKFSAKYEKDGSPMQVGDRLKIGERKKVIITIEYLDISDKNLLPKETKTIDIDFKIKYVQDNNNYTTTTNQTSLLPDGYKECEYIESTGTQYIDTGLYSNNNTSVQLAIVHYNKMGGPLFGSFNTTNAYNSRFAIYVTNTNLYGYFGSYSSNGHTVVSPAPYLTNDNNIAEFSKSGLVLNGSTVASNVNPNEEFVAQKSALIFGINGSTVNKGRARISKVKIFNNGTLIGQFISCLDDNDIPCMYDTVSGVTFYNQGTGEFNYKLK